MPIILSFSRNGNAVLVVRDNLSFSTEHNAIATPERFRDVIGKIYFNFKSYARFALEAHCPLRKMFDVSFCRA